MDKISKQYVKIYSKIFLCFFFLCLILMTTFSMILADRNKKNVEDEVSWLIKVMQSGLNEEIVDSDALNITIGSIKKDFEEKQIYLYADLFSDSTVIDYLSSTYVMTIMDDRLLASTRDYLIPSEEYDNEKEREQQVIFLDENFNEEERRILSNYHRERVERMKKAMTVDELDGSKKSADLIDTYLYTYKDNIIIKGYEQAGMIIPIEIQIFYTDVQKGTDGIEATPKDIEGEPDLKMYLSKHVPEDIQPQRIVQRAYNLILREESLRKDRYQICIEKTKNYVKRFQNDNTTSVVKSGWMNFEGQYRVPDTSIKSGWLKVEICSSFSMNQAVDGLDNSNQISLGVLYFPMEEAMKQLLYVYVLGLVLTVIFSVLLSNYYIKINSKRLRNEINRKIITDGFIYELLSPIDSIHQAATALKDHITENKGYFYLDVIKREENKMDLIVGEIINISKSKGTMTAVKKKELSLSELVQYESIRYHDILEEKHISLEVESEEECLVMADEKAMTQVVSEYLFHAVNHTSKNESIRIHIAKVQKGIQFSILYKGTEMKKESLDRLQDYLELNQASYGYKKTKFGLKYWFIIKNNPDAV